MASEANWWQWEKVWKISITCSYIRIWKIRSLKQLFLYSVKFEGMVLKKHLLYHIFLPSSLGTEDLYTYRLYVFYNSLYIYVYKIQWLKSSEAEILPGNMTEKERRTNIKGDLHVVIIIINNGQSLAKRGGKIKEIEE